LNMVRNMGEDEVASTGHRRRVVLVVVERGRVLHVV